MPRLGADQISLTMLTHIYLRATTTARATTATDPTRTTIPTRESTPSLANSRPAAVDPQEANQKPKFQ